MLPVRRCRVREAADVDGGMPLRTVAFLFVVASATTSAVPASAARILGGTLAVDGNMAVAYDTNILRIPSLSAQAGRSRDDVRYEPSASVTYSRPIGRQSVVVSALYGRDIYERNDFLSRDRLNLSGALNYAVGARCRGLASVALSRRQAGNRSALFDPDAGDPVIDPGLEDDSGRTIDNVQKLTSTALNANCASPSGALSFGGNFNRRSLRNQAFTRRFADSDTNTFGGFVGVGVFRPGQLQLVGSYTTIKYPNGLQTVGLPVPFARSAVDTYRLGLTYSRPIGSRLSGSIGASYLRGKPRDSSSGSAYSSPAYNLGLTYRPGTRMTFNLLGSRDIIASNSAGALFQVVDVVSLSTFYRASPSITARAAASLQRRDFRQSFATIEDLVARDKQTFTVLNAGVSYAPRRLYDLSFDVAHAIRKSTPSIFNYDNTSATVSLGVHF